MEKVISCGCCQRDAILRFEVKDVIYLFEVSVAAGFGILIPEGKLTGPASISANLVGVHDSERRSLDFDHYNSDPDNMSLKLAWTLEAKVCK